MTAWIKVDLSDRRKGRYRATAVGPNGPVHFPQDAPEPEVTFKCPLLNDPEPEMTDWIEHTTDTCPVDPGTVVEARFAGGRGPQISPAGSLIWLRNHSSRIFCYRIITPAKPPEPEMTNPPNYLDTLSEDQRRAVLLSCPPNPEPDLINLRLECLKLAVQEDVGIPPGVVSLEHFADRLLRYVLNGSVDKA